MHSAPNQAPQLSVSIVLHHSDIAQLRECLTSLGTAAMASIARGVVRSVSVSLVDNSCEDRYRSALDEVLDALPRAPGLSFELLILPVNRGFGDGHNRILDATDANLHLVLNPDTRLEEDTLVECVSAIIEDDEIVLVSPRVEGANGQQEFLCKRYPSVMVLLLRGFAPAFVRRWFDARLGRYEMRDVCSQNDSSDVTIASGCFMLLRMTAVRAAGGFDDAFFLYFEDFDLSMRLSQCGRLVYLPTARIHHYGGYAARKGLRHVRYFLASGARFFHRHGWQWI